MNTKTRLMKFRGLLIITGYVLTIAAIWALHFLGLSDGSVMMGLGATCMTTFAFSCIWLGAMTVRSNNSSGKNDVRGSAQERDQAVR